MSDGPVLKCVRVDVVMDDGTAIRHTFTPTEHHALSLTFERKLLPARDQGLHSRFVVPPAPTEVTIMNDRTHWAQQRRMAKLWRRATWAAALSQMPHLRREPLPPCTVSVLLPVKGGRRRDPHNYFPTVKHIVDGLVDAGCWPDDTPEYVTTIEPTLVLGASTVVIELTERR